MTIQRELNEHGLSVNSLCSRILGVLTCLALSLGAPPVLAAPVDELKAAYLLNFAKFTTWPADQFKSASDPLVFCGLIDEPVIVALRALGDRRVDSRRVSIKTIKTFNGEDGCHVMYVGEQTPSAAGRATMRKGLLLVGDSDELLKHGGTISYFLKSGKLRFDINVENAKASGLVLSARLLNLAKRREAGP